MKIVMPMAGRGARFAKEGSALPKPLIPVNGRPMFTWALDSVITTPHSQIIIIILNEHHRNNDLLRSIDGLDTQNVEVVTIPEVTQGQLSTLLMARELINTDEDILITSSDTYVVSNLAQDIKHISADTRGIISVAKLPGDHWSFARTDTNGRVVEVAEKVRISDHASTGLYYFSSGREFISAADGIIRNQEKTRGEYYVIPVYQKYIERGWRVDISTADEVWDMGTPKALSQFEAYLLRK